MSSLGVLLLFSFLGCVIAGFMIVKFKFFSITYFIKGRIIKDKTLTDIQNVHLKKIKKRYGFILTAIPILGFSWGLFGLILTLIVVGNDTFMYLTIQEIDFILAIIGFWILLNILILSLIPIIFLFTKANIPLSMKKTFNKTFLVFLALLTLLSVYYSSVTYNLTIEGILVLLLVSIPCIFSVWYIGQYYGVFIIRSVYQIRGWDFVMNKKLTIFGRIQGLSNLLLAFATPILAINSILAVIFSNTDKGGFLGIALVSLIKIDITWSFTFIQPSLEVFTQILILFLIVGPLVTFVFKPTSVFELSLNSKIYHTLSNFNWESLNESSIESVDSIIIESLTINEMIGILLIFISFINYISILSVGALLSSFNIIVDNNINLGIINSMIKVIEVPVFFFIEFLIFRDLSEERALNRLASMGKKLATSKNSSNFLVEERMIPIPKDNTNLL